LAGTTDPLAAMRANMRAFYRILGERSPGGAALERAGVLAGIVPSSPQLSIANAVVYDAAGALEASHDQLEAAYVAAGVRAWAVWVPEGDRDAGALLERRGHRRAMRTRAMTLELAEVDLDGAGEIEWEHTTDTALVAALNETAYGLPKGMLAAAATALARDPLVLYLARVAGKPAACVAALDEQGDCGIYYVATAPRAQRHGLASALMRQAIIEARARGCATSSLQASTAGFPVYRRLGYRDVCELALWERRPPTVTESPQGASAGSADRRRA
jgi:GNAT superfamily N-acetyltransferase